MHVKVPRKTLGRNLFLLRLWWEWDVDQLARKAHVPVSLIRQIEQDRGDPKLSQLRAVPDALKVREADLPLGSLFDLAPEIFCCFEAW